MSDDPNEAIAYDDLLAFFEAKNVSMKCERCGSTKWFASEGRLEKPVLPNVDLNYPELSKAALLVMIAMSCRNCGNMWLLSRQPVEEFAEGRKGGKDGQPE